MLTRLLIVAALLCVSYGPLCSQEPLHVMLSKAPLPAWVNAPHAKTLSKTVAQKKQQGWKFDQNTNSVLSASTEIQYNYLAGGRLLFNDEAGVLANSIKDKLLANDTAFRNSITMCVYYSNGTNLISLPNGFIIIDLGLFAQMENEDQLAFMISHELAHVKNRDYVTSEEPWEPEDWSEDMKKYTEYRRYREVEADLLAYEMYDKAGYSPLQALRVFEVIERNWIVPRLLPFGTELFTDSLFQYPNHYTSDLDACSKGVDDSRFFLSTQEVYSVRRSKLAAYYKIDSVTVQMKEGSDEFRKVNELAIYNCGLIALESKDYACALYLGYYLHHTDTAVMDEADLLMTKAIYLHAAMASPETEEKNTVESEDIKKPEKFGNLFFWANNPEEEEDLRGHVAGVKSFLGNLNTVESMILCVRWTWQYSQTTTRHAELATELAKNSVSMLNLKLEEPVDSLGSIQLSYRWSKADKEREEDAVDADAELDQLIKRGEQYGLDLSDKADSIKAERNRRKEKVKKEVKPADADVSTQLLSLTYDSAFTSFYSLYMAPDSTAWLADKPNPGHLSADSIYLIGANHIWTRERKRTYQFRVKEKKSDEKTTLIKRNLESGGKSSKVKLLSADPSAPDTLTLEGYNNYSMARRVFSEIMNYDMERFTYPLAYKEEFDSIADSTHVTHAVVDLAVTKQYTKIRSPVLWIASCIFIYTAPIALMYIVPTRKFTFRQTAIYNLQTGNVDWTWMLSGRSPGGNSQAAPYYSKIFKKIKKPKVKPAPAVK